MSLLIWYQTSHEQWHYLYARRRKLHVSCTPKKLSLTLVYLRRRRLLLPSFVHYPTRTGQHHFYLPANILGLREALISSMHFWTPEYGLSLILQNMGNSDPTLVKSLLHEPSFKASTIKKSSITVSPFTTDAHPSPSNLCTLWWVFWGTTKSGAGLLSYTVEEGLGGRAWWLGAGWSRVVESKMGQRLSTLLQESGRLLKSTTDFHTALRQDHSLILCCTFKPRRNLFPLSHNLTHVWLSRSTRPTPLIGLCPSRLCFGFLSTHIQLRTVLFYRHFLVHTFSFSRTSSSSLYTTCIKFHGFWTTRRIFRSQVAARIGMSSL